jgi:hypothetical protein
MHDSGGQHHLQVAHGEQRESSRALQRDILIHASAWRKADKRIFSLAQLWGSAPLLRHLPTQAS